MSTVDRYLHFENIDVEQPEISSQCSQCGQTFLAEPRAGERVDDVLLRIRDDFNSHQCQERLCLAFGGLLGNFSLKNSVLLPKR